MYQEFIVKASQSAFFTRRPDQDDDITPEVFTAMKDYLCKVTEVVRSTDDKG